MHSKGVGVSELGVTKRANFACFGPPRPWPAKNGSG